MDIAFDTSALINLDLDRSAIRIVEAKSRSLKARVILPYVAVLEILDGDDERKALDRVSLLRTMRHAIGTRLVVAADFGTIVDKEIQGTRIEHTPRVQGEEAEGVRTLLNLVPFELESFRALRAGIPDYLAKGMALNKDEQARAEARDKLSNFTTADLKELLASAPKVALTSGNPIIGGLARAHPTFRLERLSASPRQYASTTVVATYAYLIMVGSMFADHRASFPRYLKGPRNGSWTDAKVAGCAARAQVLISDDSEQRAKVEYVAEHFGLEMRTQGLDEWLGGR